MNIKLIVLLFSFLIAKNLCYVCNFPPSLVLLDNGIEYGIVSQPSSCFEGYTVMAQNNDENKNIKIQFTIVPLNFRIDVYDGKIDNGILQNCQFQNGSICFSSGNSVTFYFVSKNFEYNYNNRVELVVTPYVQSFNWDYTSTKKNIGFRETLSIMTLIFSVFLFCGS